MWFICRSQPQLSLGWWVKPQQPHFRKIVTTLLSSSLQALLASVQRVGEWNIPKRIFLMLLTCSFRRLEGLRLQSEVTCIVDRYLWEPWVSCSTESENTISTDRRKHVWQLVCLHHLAYSLKTWAEQPQKERAFLRSFRGVFRLKSFHMRSTLFRHVADLNTVSNSGLILSYLINSHECFLIPRQQCHYVERCVLEHRGNSP